MIETCNQRRPASLARLILSQHSCPILNHVNMRLINTQTLQFKEFIGDQVPLYVILSHTWGEDEVLFTHMQNGTAPQREGYKKVQETCKQALKDRYLWVWIDTCCIDKSSSSELQEAINSMYRWYAAASICYVYLVDVSDDVIRWGPQVLKSRWWTRGWTLRMSST